MLANLITRIFSIIFTAVVLGLSVSAAKWQVFGSAPATTVYGAFTGAFGLLVALVGLVAAWIEAIPGVLMAVVDALSALLLLAGGIAFAVGIRGVDCSLNVNKNPYGAERTAANGLLNGGTLKSHGKPVEYGVGNSVSKLKSHCRQIEADTVFLFLAFVGATVTAVICFLGHGSGGRRIGRTSAV